MLKYIITTTIIFSNILFGQLNHLSTLDTIKRDDGKLYVWVYFTDKDKSLKKINVSNKTNARRTKVNPNTDFSWYDLSPSEKYIDDVLRTGSILRGESRWLNAISVECDEEQLLEISALPFVNKIKPLAQYKKNRSPEIPDDTRSLSKSFGVNDIDYGNSFEQLEQINVPAAHNAGYYGQDVRVLILDSGFNLDHAVFDSLSIIAEWDVINDDSTTMNEEDDGDISSQHNHGTSVFSILGGYAPGRLIGPAFKSSFLLAKTEIIGNEIQIEEDNFVRGLEWGEARGADVMTTSLGYTDWYTISDMDGNTAVTTISVDIASSLGVTCITSAGNENGNSWDTIAAPADADSVISVGAVDNEGQITYFSSRGPTADGRIKPEVCAWGLNTYLASGNGVSYATGSGTSYAAPLVAGAAAIILSAKPNWTPMMVREALIETASQSQSPDNIYGWGIIDVWAAINYFSGDLSKPELNQNFPNPFNTNTTIEYILQQSSIVKLKVYNISGEEVITLVNKFEPSGLKSVTWNGKDKNGFSVSSGVYLYNLITADNNLTNKMVFVK